MFKHGCEKSFKNLNGTQVKLTIETKTMKFEIL